MAARLILNADDFGLTNGVNRAVAELHDAGALPSATLMATGAAFDDAVAVARARPSLAVGCHVVLLDGEPLSPPAEIPTLLGRDGKNLRTSLAEFAIAAARGSISEDDILCEALAQIQRLQRAGLHVTHLDTHKHTHILPAVTRPLLRLAERLGIGAIRNPFEPRWASAAASGSVLRRTAVGALQPLRKRFFAQPAIRGGRIATTDGTLGISATGDLNPTTLAALLASLPADGVWEIVTHPGYNDADLDGVETRLRAERETELRTLLDAFGPSKQNSGNPSWTPLIHYGMLLNRYGMLRKQDVQK